MNTRFCHACLMATVFSSGALTGAALSCRHSCCPWLLVLGILTRLNQFFNVGKIAGRSRMLCLPWISTRGQQRASHYDFFLFSRLMPSKIVISYLKSPCLPSRLFHPSDCKAPEGAVWTPCSLLLGDQPGPETKGRSPIQYARAPQAGAA